MEIIIVFLLIVIAVLLFMLLRFKKQSVVNEVKNKFIVLNKVNHKSPSIKDVDPNDTLLKDIIESAEIEDWIYKVDIDETSYRRSYTLILNNPTETLRVFATIHAQAFIDGFGIEKEDLFSKSTNIGVFTVSNIGGESIPYDNTHSHLTLPFLWKYVTKHLDEIYKLEFQKKTDAKNNISDKLTTLNRDRKINKLL